MQNPAHFLEKRYLPTYFLTLSSFTFPRPIASSCVRLCSPSIYSSCSSRKWIEVKQMGRRRKVYSSSIHHRKKKFNHCDLCLIKQCPPHIFNFLELSMEAFLFPLVKCELPILKRVRGFHRFLEAWTTGVMHPPLFMFSILTLILQELPEVGIFILSCTVWFALSRSTFLFWILLHKKFLK